MKHPGRGFEKKLHDEGSAICGVGSTAFTNCSDHESTRDLGLVGSQPQKSRGTGGAHAYMVLFSESLSAYHDCVTRACHQAPCTPSYVRCVPVGSAWKGS